MSTRITETFRRELWRSGCQWLTISHIYHSVIFMFLMLMTSSSALTVKVNSSVVLRLPATKLTLPCDFYTQADNNLCIVFWERGLRNISKVIYGYPGGGTFPGPAYKDRARLGSGCSCELDNPNENDTGIYKVKIVCHEYTLAEYSAVVNVAILPKAAPSKGIFRETTYSEQYSSTISPTQEEEVTESVDLLNYALVSCLVLMGVTLVVLLACLYFRRKRRLCWSRQSDHETKGGTEETKVFLQHIPEELEEELDPDIESSHYQCLCQGADKLVRTSLFHNVLSQMEHKNSLLLIANFGDGTSTIIKQISLEYGANGYLTLEIQCPEDIRKYDITGRRVLLVCENVIEESEINDNNVNAWINSDMDHLVTFAEDVKLLLAYRLDLFSTPKRVLRLKKIFKDIVDIRSAELTIEDKMNILHYHFKDKLSEEVSRRVAENSHFAFPECCRFVSQSHGDTDFLDANKLVEIFSDPFDFVLKRLKVIESTQKHRYATLVFCLLNQRKFPTTCTPQLLEQPNFKVIRNLYLSDRMCSGEQIYDTLLDTAQDLDGWLLTRKGDSYDFYHNSIFAAMCRIHGSRYPKHILTFCKFEVVISLFTTEQLPDVNSDRITLAPHCFPELVQIVTRECLNMADPYLYRDTWKFVFQEMNKPGILKQWHKHMFESLKLNLKKSEKSATNLKLAYILNLMTLLPDSHLTLDGVYQYAIYHGDLDTSVSLTDIGVTAQGRGRGLETAVEEGHCDIVRWIVRRGDLDMNCMRKALRTGIMFDRKECVTEILMLKPDGNTLHSALKYAIENEKVEYLPELLKGAQDTKTIHGVLNYAMENEKVEYFVELLKVDLGTKTIHSVLMQAIRNGRIDFVKEILKHPFVCRQNIQATLNTPSNQLFTSDVAQPICEEICKLLHAYLDSGIMKNGIESLEVC